MSSIATTCARRDFRHAVIGDDHQVDAVAQAACFAAHQQATDRCVDRRDHRGRFRGESGPYVVARLVEQFEVQRREANARRGFGRAIRRTWSTRAASGTACRMCANASAARRGSPPANRARTSSPHARLRFSAVTQIGSAPFHQRPSPAFSAALLLEVAERRVAHDVVHDAVAIRPQAGHQRVVVRERERGIRRPHAVGAHAGVREARQVRRESAVEVIRAEAIDRDQQHRRVVAAGRLRHRGAGREHGAQQQGAARPGIACVMRSIIADDTQDAAADAHGSRCAAALFAAVVTAIRDATRKTP